MDLAGSDDGGSTSAGSDSGSDKSTAIVPMDWHDKGYGALFTMESNEVLFEFVMRNVPTYWYHRRELGLMIDS